MEFEEIFTVVDAEVFAKTKRRLKDVERFVLQGASLGQTYDEMAKASAYRYTPSYLKQDIGPKLWKQLSEVLGEDISKTNFQSALVRQAQLLPAAQKRQELAEKLYETEAKGYERNHAPLKLVGETPRSFLAPTYRERSVEGVRLQEEKQLACSLTPTSLEPRKNNRPAKLSLADSRMPWSTTSSLSSFVAGPPITHPRHFFGRERELKRIFNLYKHLPLQNAAVIGPRQSGKTSLLKYLKTITTASPVELRPEQHANWLPIPELYHWVFIDFQDPRLGTREGLLRYLLTCLELPTPASFDLDHFLDVVSCNLRTRTVFLFDEIGIALQRYRELDDCFWDSLRSLASHQVGNLAFILASHEPPKQLAEQSSLHSPFFNSFGYTTQLKPLTQEESRELISSSPLPFPPLDVDWILAQSKCWPVLLQILCRERLIALESSETHDTWKQEGLAHLKPYRYLLEE
ncbi:MAG: ATP-binding protein [Chroococcidiopsidaceae cyanobacterium CP_BM_ER_R8_30]|nr:ATP-binding protein [Chroococcidiopsidaceae cyanobacterium CP_BM_ER_R8_30]